MSRIKLYEKYPPPDLPPCNDAGDYYRNKSLEADHWGEELKKAKASGAEPYEIYWLTQRLEEARYVGD